MSTNNNIGDLVSKAQEMQRKMQQIQEALAKKHVKGTAGGGKVVITMTGRHDVIQVSIDASLFKEDKVILEDLLAAAFNQAVRLVEQASQQQINELAASFNIAGEFLDKTEED